MSYSGGAGGFLLFHLILLEQLHDVDLQVHPFHVKKFLALNPSFFHKLRISEEFYNSIKEDSFPDYQEYYKNYSSFDKKTMDKLIRHHIRNPANVNDFPEWRDFVLDEVIESQWNITNVEEWKWGEYWPINSPDFIPRPGRNRLFLSVNEYDEWMQFPGVKLFLYTDIHTQTRMALKKRAHWFYRPATADSHMNYSFIKSKLKENELYNGIKVHKDAIQCLTNADQTILLQNLLADPTSVGLSNNNRQQELIDHWINLHKKFNLYDKVMRGY